MKNEEKSAILEIIAIKRNKAQDTFRTMKDNFYLGEFHALEELFWLLKDGLKENEKGH